MAAGRLPLKRKDHARLPNPLPRIGFPLIAAILAAGLSTAGGCRSPDPTRDFSREMVVSYRLAVADIVNDPTRAEALVRLGDDLARELETALRVRHQLEKELVELYRDYSAKRPALEAAQEAVRHQQRHIRRMLLETRAAAVELTTPEEWALLTRRPDALMQWFQRHPEYF